MTPLCLARLVCDCLRPRLRSWAWWQESTAKRARIEGSQELGGQDDDEIMSEGRKGAEENVTSDDEDGLLDLDAFLGEVAESYAP